LVAGIYPGEGMTDEHYQFLIQFFSNLSELTPSQLEELITEIQAKIGSGGTSKDLRPSGKLINGPVTGKISGANKKPILRAVELDEDKK